MPTEDIAKEMRDAIKRHVIEAIDQAAGVVRARRITVALCHGLVNWANAKDSERRKAASATNLDLDPADYPFLVAKGGIFGDSNSEFADIVLAIRRD